MERTEVNAPKKLQYIFWFKSILWKKLIFTVMAVISLYEAIRHIFMAMIYGCARPRMVVLFLSSIFPHLYGWWTYFNYYNDDFYQQWWHQLFFSLTELFSTLMVLHLINRSNITSLPRKLLFIIRYLHKLFFNFCHGCCCQPI